MSGRDWIGVKAELNGGCSRATELSNAFLRALRRGEMEGGADESDNLSEAEAKRHQARRRAR